MDLEKLSEQIDHKEMELDRKDGRGNAIYSAVVISSGSMLIGFDLHEVAPISNMALEFLGSIAVGVGVYSGLVSIGKYMKSSNPLNYIRGKSEERSGGCVPD